MLIYRTWRRCAHIIETTGMDIIREFGLDLDLDSHLSFMGNRIIILGHLGMTQQNYISFDYTKAQRFLSSILSTNLSPLKLERHHTISAH
jgi:hypothetical protein